MFVAVQPPEAVRDDLAAFLQARDGLGVRWLDPDQWHLTLAFCAAVPERSVEGFAGRLESAFAGRAPMRLQLAGAGAFPHPDRAKVLWLGVVAAEDDPGAEPVARLHAAAAAARTAATVSGIEVDGATFRPHLSLARLRRPMSATRWLRVLDTYRSPAWAADAVTLVASHLGQGPAGRPRYETLQTIALRG